nr:GNAT family N-acetyltransferase [Marinilactibacillus sp. 15R]
MLRDYIEEDFDFLYSLLSNKQIMRYIGTGEIRDKLQTEIFLNRMREFYEVNAFYGLKVIELKENGEKIGHAGFVPQVIEDVKYMEIGYWISEDYWNRGYATEIAQGLKKFGRDMLQLEEVISLIQTENIASQRVAEKNEMSILKKINLKGRTVYIYSSKVN